MTIDEIIEMSIHHIDATGEFNHFLEDLLQKPEKEAIVPPGTMKGRQ